MGRTSLPLVIVTAVPGVEFDALKAQGHTVLTYQEAKDQGVSFADADLIFGPNARWFTQAMMRYLGDALKAAREAARTRKRTKET